MKKTLLYTLLACTIAAASASAGTFKVPNEDFAIASVTIPDSWKPEAIEKGVQGNSPDNEIYIAIDAVGSDKGFDAELDETIKMLQDNKVTLDVSSKKVNKFKVNGLDATEILYQGKMDDEAQGISIVIIPIKDKALVMTYWTSVAKEKEHQAEVGNILKSIKPL